MLKSNTIQKIGFLIIIGGLFYFQIIKGDHFAQRSKSNYVRLIPKIAPRGIIYDKNGEPLLKNKLQFQVCLYSKENIEEISRILEVPSEKLKARFKHNFIASFIPTPIYTTSKRSKILQLEQKNFPELSIQIKAKRKAIYPHSFSHILGYTKKISSSQIFLKKYGYSLKERIGNSGIEKYYDDYLRGKSGGIQLEVNAKGKTVNILGQKSPVPGKNIHTTLDPQYQMAALKALNGFRGSLILMEVKTGKIRCLANNPSFNLNKITSSAQYFREITQNKNTPLINRATQGEYAPGSVFKPSVALAALEENKISKNTRFLCKGVFDVKGTEFKCWNTHGWQNLIEGLTHSCNIFFYNLGLRLGIKKLRSYALNLGLGKRTNIDLPFEQSGFIPSPSWKKKRFNEGWYTGDTLNFSIGQGAVLTTPVQIAKMMSFFATGGYLIQPYIVKRIGNIQIASRTKKLVKAKQKNIELINQGLLQVVKSPSGTANVLKGLQMDIAGKTGTAQVSGKKSHGWFSGFFPYKNPKYIIVSLVENGGSSYEACKVIYKFLSEVKTEL